MYTVIIVVLCATAIICMSLDVPTNGQVSYSGPAPYGFGTVATYTCDNGVTATRSCGGDSSSMVGVWNGTAPSCAGKAIVFP